MKIMYVHKDINQSMNAGGINTVYLRHIEYASKFGHEIHVITSRDGIWNLKAVRHIVPLDLNERNKQIKKIINEVKPDIIDVFNWGAELLEFVSKPHIGKIVMRADIPMKFYGKESIDEKMARNCDRIISISKWCNFEWASILGENTKIIPHGCDAPKKINKLKVPNSVLWVGKATDIKGFDLLFKLPNEFFNDFKLYVICAKTNFTDKALFDKLESKGVIIKENLTQEEYDNLLSQIEFVISTARKEGFCIAVLEAMSYGAIPVIPFWIGGTTHFVNNKCGIIYKTFGECYKKMKNEKLKNEKSKFSIITAKKYNWEKIVKSSLKLYEMVLKNE